MENVKIEELIKEIKENHREDYTKIYIDCLCDYNDGCYICDAIAQISDYKIDIYYKDLFEWAKNNFSDIEEANKEYGDVNPDITKQIVKRKRNQRNFRITKRKTRRIYSRIGFGRIPTIF